MRYVKKFFSMLFEDLHWKLLALFAASIIWFIGMNMSDPYQNLIVSPRLQLENIQVMHRDNIVVLNEDALRDINVSVLVRGLRSDMEILRAAITDPVLLSAFVEVSVDFRAIESEAVASSDGVSTQSLRISVNLQSGYEHLSINPSHIDVALDVTGQQSFTVQEIQTGDVPPGFELQYINLGNDRVTIRGSRTDLRMIGSVQAITDITGVVEDAELPVVFQVLDLYGNDMTDRVRLNISETMARIRVWQIRQVDIDLRSVGLPANGYASAGIDREFSTVEIVGPEALLDEIDFIRIDFDLTGARSNIPRTINISDWLPEGVHLREGETSELPAIARIEPIEERTLTIPRGNIRSRGVVGHYSLVNENTQIRVTVSGASSRITSLTASDIELEFDLRALPIGIHTVPLIVDLPRGITLIGLPPTLVVQIHEPASVNGDDDYEELNPIPSPDPTTPPIEDDDPEDINLENGELSQGALDDDV